MIFQDFDMKTNVSTNQSINSPSEVPERVPGGPQLNDRMMEPNGCKGPYSPLWVYKWTPTGPFASICTLGVKLIIDFTMCDWFQCFETQGDLVILELLDCNCVHLMNVKQLSFIKKKKKCLTFKLC